MKIRNENDKIATNLHLLGPLNCDFLHILTCSVLQSEAQNRIQFI